MFEYIIENYFIHIKFMNEVIYEYYSNYFVLEQIFGA